MNLLLKFLWTEYPWRAIAVVGLLTVSGLAEGLGIVALLPLISIAADGEVGTTAIASDINRGLEAVGVEPTLGAVLGLIIVALSVKSIFTFLALQQAGYMGADIASDLRLRMIEALVRARWGYFTAQPLGAVSNSMGIEALRASQITSEMCYLIAGAVQVVVYLGLALLVSWKLTLGAGLFGGLLFLALNGIVQRAREAGRKESELLRSLNGRLADGLASIKALKAMGLEKTLLPLLKEETRQLNAAQRRQALSRAALPTIQEPLIAIALATGLYLALRETNSFLGEVMFLVLVFHRIATRMGNVQFFFQSVLTLEGAFWSLQSLLSGAQDAQESHKGLVRPSLDDRITFDQVSFKYEEKQVLDRFEMSIPAGSFVTLIGPSGAGKTTVVDLIAGLILPHEGQILIDGQPITRLDINEWRSMIGYVPQDAVLAHDTIRSNLTLGDSTIDDASIQTALSSAGAWGFVSQLPEGVDTTVGERGSKFSGGQRQRIALARALLRNPRLLILDEATSALDPRSEAEVCAALEGLKGNTTILAISHQAGLVDIADQVVKLDPPEVELAQERAAERLPEDIQPR